MAFADLLKEQFDEPTIRKIMPLVDEYQLTWFKKVLADQKGLKTQSGTLQMQLLHLERELSFVFEKGELNEN